MRDVSLKRGCATVLVTTVLFGVVVACSGSSAIDIPPSSSFLDASSIIDSGSGVVDAEARDVVSQDTCPACAPPPSSACVGTGPCGCEPYICPDAGTDAGAGIPCTWSQNDPCGPGKYCSAPNCGKGTCVPRGVGETSSRDPWCGCDGVTYWNESVAAKRGMSTRKKGACTVTAACGFGDDCTNGAVCNYRVPSEDDCNVSEHTGTCWMMPVSCPASPAVLHTLGCSKTQCANECQLIKLAIPWYETNVCN